MQRNTSNLESRNYDLLIVGGGINGAAIANLAAYNGLKCCLLEKNDFASGTSSKSTKLIHGGLRYLENFEFDLVKEALHERFLLHQSAPHLIKPLSFIIPVYQDDLRPLWQMKLGVWLYDFFCGSFKIGRHETLTSEEIKRRIPGVNDKGLVGGVLYYDAQMNDARLCLENVLSARKFGADVFNYIEVKTFIKENGQVKGVVAFDQIIQKEIKIFAKKIVCALGPWTDQVIDHEHEKVKDRVRTTKGVHLVCRGSIGDSAMLIPTQKNKRIFFAIPFMGNTLIGTTDTDYQASPDSVSVETEDIDYLLNEIQRVFPSGQFTKDKIISSFAGLRPLVYQNGHPSAVSRKHKIDVADSGVVYVMGGKYTTFRIIAEDCLKKIIKEPLVDTRNSLPLYGGGQVSQDLQGVSKEHGVSVETIEYLIETYGTKFEDILILMKKDASLKEPICECSLAVKAQVKYSIETEMALKLEDIYERRLALVYCDCTTGQCRKYINDSLLTR